MVVMGNQTDYFNRIGYYGQYDIGDRVFGHYQKIPFVGSVGNDRKINDTIGPEVTVHLDLPMMTKQGVRHVVVVKHKDIKRLTDYEDKPTTAGVRRAAKAS
jgi:hypothetical protein